MAASLTAVRDRTPAAEVPSPAERAALCCPDPLATVDAAGLVAWANPAWTRLLGEDLPALVRPEDRPRLLAALADPGGEVELRVRVRGGRTRWIAFALAGIPGGPVALSGRDVTDRRRREDDGRFAEAFASAGLSSAVRAPDGTPAGPVALVEDAPERGRMVEALTLSQARYETLVRHLPDAAVVLFDRDLRVQMVEGALLAHAAALEGRALADVLPPERVDDLLPHFAAAAAGDPRSFDHERLDGSATYWTQIVPLAAPDGSVFGGMAVFRDVTERRDAARALEAHARELEASNLELEQYASLASHDLSAPLRMVSGYLGLLRRRHGAALGPDADALIAQAVEGAARMRTLIDDLLAYSQVGRDAPAPQPVDLAAVVADVAAVVHACAPDAEIGCGALPAVWGDPGLLRQLFQNLLGNAVKFVPEGRRARVRVRAHGNRFEVEDNGIGIDPEHAERIFRMFQRLDTREGFAGTGIGLAIARKVVERHGGTLWVEPAEGGGSRFCFTLPLVG